MPGFEIRGGPTPVHSDASATSGDEHFIPMTGAIQGHRVSEVRVAIHLESDSGNVEVQRAYQVSEDGVTWTDGTTQFDAISVNSTWVGSGDLDSTNWHYQDTATNLWEDLSSLETDGMVRFGLLVKNSSGTRPETARARIIVDARYT